MNENEKKANELLKEAEKACGKLSFWSLFNGDKYDNARGIFVKAGACYKACGNFLEAARAYERAADMSKKAKSDINLVVDLEEAARCYAKTKDTSKAVKLYLNVITHYEKDQMHVKAAKMYVSLSEITQGKESVKWIEKAADSYRLQGSRVTADDLMRKVADAKAKDGDYQAARLLYEQLAHETLNNAVIRGGARKLFFMALLVQLATFTSDSLQEDVASLKERFEEYQELDTQFDRLTREHMLIDGIIEAIEEESLEKMELAVNEYDNICVLDELKKKLLSSAMAVLHQRLDSLR